MTTLSTLLAEIRFCRLCEAHLPLGPRPVVQASRRARLLIIGQAPGTKVHASGVPFADASGDRLRDWLDIDAETFYDPDRVAIMPMGFCYPGRMERGGDAPPRPECAPAWHDRLLASLSSIRLTLLVGAYAQKQYLADSRGATLTETVRCFDRYLERGFFCLPHPSWRTRAWQRKRPWFDQDVIPALRRAVRRALSCRPRRPCQDALGRGA